MKPIDKLIHCETMILQFEQRTNAEAFDNLIWISTDVRRALHLINKIHDIDTAVVSRQNSVNHFRGTRDKTDSWTIQNFDRFKRDLLAKIKEAKILLEQVEGTSEIETK